MKKDSIALFFDNLSKNSNLINKYNFMLLINNKFVVDNKSFSTTNVSNIIKIVKKWDGKIETFNLSLSDNVKPKNGDINWYENTISFYNKKLNIYAKLDIKSQNIDTDVKTIETRIASNSVDGKVEKLINMKKFILDTNTNINNKILSFSKS